MVRSLEEFINDRCPAGCYTVNIQEEISKFQKLNPGRTPTIVLDSRFILSIFLKNNDEIFCGGRMDVNKERMDKFFRKLKIMGADLVFFDDGIIKNEKITSWLTSVNKKYGHQWSIFETLKKNLPIHLCFRRFVSFSVYEVFRQNAKKYGKVYQSVHTECGTDCAAYATKINAVGVITMNADFLIMPGDWPIWVASTINVESYTITTWDKRALRRTLNLAQPQMPIFATITGINFIQHEKVLNFKRKFWYSIDQTSKFILNNFPSGVPLSRAEFLHLVDVVYEAGYNSSVKEAADMVHTTLEYFSYNHDTPEIEPEWLKNYCEDTFSHIVYSLHTDRPIFVHQTYIDLSMRDVRPYCDLALPIIRKQMGVSDYYKKRENIERIIFLKPSHEEPFQQKKTTPIFPDFEIPPLNILLGYDVTEEQNASLDDQRLKIVCWSISTGAHQVEPEVFNTIQDKAFIVSILVLTYLVKELQITSEEADVMLLSIHETMNASYEKLETIEPPELYDQRGFWLAHVFLRLRGIYLDSFLLCGLNEYHQYDSYDGFIFHKMFKKYPLLDSETKRLLRKPIEPFRIYAKD